MKLYDVDLSLPESFDNGFPHEYFAFLRREHPLVWHPESSATRLHRRTEEGPGFYVLTKYEDVKHVGKHPKLFSSWVAGTNIPDPTDEALAGLRLIMLNMDPPQHVKFRKLVRSGFTPRKIGQLRYDVEALAAHIVDRVAGLGECDFVEEISCELPLQVIAELMGVPQKDRHRIFDWSNRLIGFDDPDYNTSEEDGRIASAEMWAYANELAAERQRNPMDDLVTKLLTGEVDGERLSEMEFDSFFLLLAVAGNETTRNLISQGMRALFEHPNQFERLKRDPSLIDSAVEEMLRWSPPVMYFRRTVTEDTELSGVPLQKGDKVTLWYPSANRDETVFDRPNEFDVGRSPNQHISFGMGEHFCLGSHLARMEIQIMFREIVKRLPDIRLAGDIRLLSSNFIDGIKSMPVAFTPQAA